jgi:hypothetical protein
MQRDLVESWKRLLSNGYSPLPIKQGTKRPALLRWSAACAEPLSPQTLRDEAERCPNAGTGVALGFKGLIAIDRDTDDPEFNAALSKVVPASPVAKRGKKGRTDFYRTTQPWESTASRRHGRLSPLGAHRDLHCKPCRSAPNRTRHAQGRPSRNSGRD